MIFLPFFILAALIFVNGWTDAPNAITCPIVTGCMKEKNAVVMSGIFNLIGCVVTSLIGGKVIEVTLSACDFKSGEETVRGLCFAMLAVVIWSVAAWIFGIPTSESHGIFAAMAGVSMAYSVKNGFPVFSGINTKAFLAVIVGLAVSTLPAYLLATMIKCLFCSPKGSHDHQKTNENNVCYGAAQICGAAVTSFMHGAQDGQKFIGIFILLLNSVTGAPQGYGADKKAVALASVTVALIMTVGTFMGGGRIIRHTGEDMVSLDKKSGFVADISSSAILLLCVFFGMPVSTTHTKTCAMMGAGKGLSKKVVSEMLIAWIATLPACAALGFLLVSLFG